MAEKAYLCPITYKKEIANGIIDMKIKCTEMADKTECGQFLHIKCGEGINTFLRRPISVCDVTGDEIRFLFQVKGEGTKALAKFEAGDSLDVLGPLGNTFRLHYKQENPVVVGGGIGVFPLLLLCKNMNIKPYVSLGFRSKELVVMEDEFKDVSNGISIYTDDGSYGERGFATNKLEELAKKDKCDMIYACGPTPMLRIVKEIAEKYKIKAQISLEERMGCGIGACLSCACEVKTPEKYRHVCKHGPIFMADEVVI